MGILCVAMKFIGGCGRGEVRKAVRDPPPWLYARAMCRGPGVSSGTLSEHLMCPGLEPRSGLSLGTPRIGLQRHQP